MCNDYKARKVLLRRALCFVFLSTALGHARIAGDSRPAASVSAASIQLEDASESAATTATAATAATASITDAAAGTDASGRCRWTREPPAES